MIWFDRLVLSLAWLAAVFFIVAGIMLTYEVMARYFFIKPTIWAAELSQLCLIWGSLLAMAWLLSARRHIAVDAVIQLLPPIVQRWTESAAMLVVAAFSAMVTWKGWDIFIDSFERGRTTGSLLDLPIWIVELAVPFGFALLFIQSLKEAVRSAKADAEREIIIE